MVQEAIEVILKQKLGLDANSIGKRTIDRIISQRQLACGLHDRAAYFTYLQSSPQELENLIEAIVVPETWFFRDKEAFTYLQSYIATEWRPANPSTVLRILSAPCSTGEEPYSIAIALLEAGLTPRQFRIDAVDISKVALQKAQQAVYRKNSFRGNHLHNKQHYFQSGENGCVVHPTVRHSVQFIQANLLEPRFLKNNTYHIIFCRNLLIYLDTTARAQLLQGLDQALVPSGLLFVGAVETIQIPTKHYTPIDHAFAFAYRKSSPAPFPQVAVPAPKTIRAHPPPQARQAPKPIDRPPVAISQLETAKQLANQGLLTQAMQICKAFLRANSTDFQAYLLLGEIYQGLNQPDAAERCFHQALYLNPNEYTALIHLSLLKEQRGDRKGAEALKKRAQRLINSPI